MSITLEGAIIHAEDVVAEKLENAEFIKRNPYGDKSKIQGCLDCAAEHRQLAAWLRELQERRKAPEIVHCGECKHRDPEDKKCDCGHDIIWQLPRGDDWYCADAEKKHVENG